MVFGRLLPREGNFFELFNEHGKYIAEGANAFMLLVQHYENPDERERHAIAVGAAERSADKVTAEVHRLLHRTFITPLDRDQIHRLINAMDDVLDLLQVPANRIGYAGGYTLAQLKIAQEVITLAVFVPFAVVYMQQPLKWDYLWAGLCLVGAVYFIFRS